MQGLTGRSGAGSGEGVSGYRVLDDQSLGRLHRAGLAVLERTGVEVRDERALADLARAGARVEGTRARIPAALVEEAVATAPGSFLLSGRAGGDSAGDAPADLDLEVRPGSGYFGNGTDCLYFRDPASGERRRAVLDDVEQTAAVCELLAGFDFVMSGVLPADVPLETIDLAQFAALLKGTRKPLVISPASAGETLPQMLEMAGLAGRSDSFAVLGMTNPPLILDGSCVGKARACGAAGVPFITGPGDQMGATGPASVAGSVTLGHAETLAVLVLHQLNAPGAPFVYGTGAGSTFDMRTFVDVWSSPEGTAADAVSCQLAISLGLPSWSFAGTSEAKTLDGQWAAETAISTIVAAQMGASLLHDVGEFEAGVQNSLESLVFGDALIGYARRLTAGVRVDDETLQLDDIDAVGPGGSYLARPYTRRHHRDLWRSDLFDTATHEHWVAAGSPVLVDRLRDAVGDILARREPLLDEAVAAQLDSFWRVP
jgi:trimethylamine---corrinoid protein Co-methyltransferase